MSNNASFYQSTNSSTSTLRPRNNRLISYEDGHDPLQSSPAIARTTFASSTSHATRSASPPAAGASIRAQSKGKQAPASLLRDSSHHKVTTSHGSGADRRPSSGIWESWSSLQGLASTFLGSDASVNGPVRRANSTNVKRNKVRMIQDKSYNPKQAQPEWGPRSQQADTKPTSIEDHKALLQAKKREALLLQSVSSQAGQTSLGRYKRKDSDASIPSLVDTPSLEDDVLVYRHKVLAHDTMAGVVIKYSCQPEVFRKVNRFWPNDNIQRRKWVVLPVDACAVRGKKTETPHADGSLDRETGRQPMTTTSNVTMGAGAGEEKEASAAIEPFPPAETPSREAEENNEYRHDSWVLLPTNPQPIEILRISKNTLGYFPPARRKSPTRYESLTPFTDSAVSTPKSSFDMLRHPPTHAAQQAQLNQQLASLSLNSSPVRGHSSVPRRLTSGNPSRSRSSSTVSTANGTASSNKFLAALSGPGGVGTLRGLRSERAQPGPPDDPLNKKFAGYFPEFLPPDHPDYQPTSNGNTLRPPHSRAASNSLNASLRTTPRASIDSIRSTRSNSSNVLAGWVGKVANTSSPKGVRKKNDLRLERNDLTGSLAGIGEAEDGDLIELSDTPDEVSRQLHDAVESALDDRTPTATPRIGVTNVDEARSDEELMNERFPIRGKVMRAYEADWPA